MPSARIAVRVQPRAARQELAGLRDGVLVVRVTAPAVDGRANKALCRLLADHLDVAPSRLTLVRGERSREKLIDVDGLDQAEAEARLGLTPGGPPA